VGLGNPIMPSKDMAIVFNCYDAPIGSTAEACIDSGSWIQMQKYTEKSGYIKMQMPHHFILHTDTTKLVPGKHRIGARVTWPDGTVVTETTGFIVSTQRT
jgi:hypothetical protein